MQQSNVSSVNKHWSSWKYVFRTLYRDWKFTWRNSISHTPKIAPKLMTQMQLITHFFHSQNWWFIFLYLPRKLAMFLKFSVFSIHSLNLRKVFVFFSAKKDLSHLHTFFWKWVTTTTTTLTASKQACWKYCLKFYNTRNLFFTFSVSFYLVCRL